MLRSHGCTVDALDFKIDFGNLWANSIAPPVVGNSLNATLPVNLPSTDYHGAPVPSGRVAVNIIRNPLAARNPSDHSNNDGMDKYSSIELEDTVFNVAIQESLSGERK